MYYLDTCRYGLSPQSPTFEPSPSALGRRERLGCGHALVHHILRDLQTICARILCGLMRNWTMRCFQGRSNGKKPVERNHGTWNFKGPTNKKMPTHVLYLDLVTLKSCFIWKSSVTPRMRLTRPLKQTTPALTQSATTPLTSGGSGWFDHIMMTVFTDKTLKTSKTPCFSSPFFLVFIPSSIRS